MNDPKENPLTLSWQDSAWIPILNPTNIMDYFSERSNLFYDRTCNNEIVKMQRLSPDQLTNMTGVEYILLHVQEPILYVIRKQHRHTPTQATPLADYYIIAGVVYQAPDLGSVFNSRLLSAVHNLQSAFDESLSYSRYHPSKGYTWDFKDKSIKSTSAGTNNASKDNPSDDIFSSSYFQRHCTDKLLENLTIKFPIKGPTQQSSNTAAAEATKQQVTEDVKPDTSKIEVKTEKPGTPTPTQGGRMRPPPEKKPRMG